MCACELYCTHDTRFISSLGQRIFFLLKLKHNVSIQPKRLIRLRKSRALTSSSSMLLFLFIYRSVLRPWIYVYCDTIHANSVLSNLSKYWRNVRLYLLSFTYLSSKVVMLCVLKHVNFWCVQLTRNYSNDISWIKMLKPIDKLYILLISLTNLIA